MLPTYSEQKIHTIWPLLTECSQERWLKSESGDEREGEWGKRECCLGGLFYIRVSKIQPPLCQNDLCRNAKYRENHQLLRPTPRTGLNSVPCYWKLTGLLLLLENVLLMLCVLNVYWFTYTMNVLPAGLTPPIGVRRTITDECFGMWASSSVYSTKHEKKLLHDNISDNLSNTEH